MFSVVAAIGLAGGALAFLFHDVDAVEVTLRGPSFATSAEVLVYEATVVVPAGQRLPVAGFSLVVQDPGTTPPAVVDLATCLGEAACTGPLRHLGPHVLPGIAIEQMSASAAPTSGPLWVWVKGYGRTAATGYGAEVETQRKLTATDLVDEQGVGGQGRGYGGDEPVTIVYEVRLDTRDLAVGEHGLAVLVETGSRDMGGVSSALLSLTVASPRAHRDSRATSST